MTSRLREWWHRLLRSHPGLQEVHRCEQPGRHRANSPGAECTLDRDGQCGQKISDEAPDQGAKDAWKKYADATNAVNNAIGPVSNPDDVAKKLNDQGFATAFNNFNNSWNDLVKNYKDAIAGSCSVTLVGQATA